MQFAWRLGRWVRGYSSSLKMGILYGLLRPVSRGAGTWPAGSETGWVEAQDLDAQKAIWKVAVTKERTTFCSQPGQHWSLLLPHKTPSFYWVCLPSPHSDLKYDQIFFFLVPEHIKMTKPCRFHSAQFCPLGLLPASYCVSVQFNGFFITVWIK